VTSILRQSATERKYQRLRLARCCVVRVCPRLSHANDPQVETSVKTSVNHHKEILWIARDDQPLDPRVEARQNARFVWRCSVAFEI
jgi:hypothetical protein